MQPEDNQLGRSTKQFLLHVQTGVAVFTMLLLAGCAATSPDKGGPTQEKLDEMSDSTIAALLESKPEVQALISDSAGYVVLNMTATKIPVIGTAIGYGVVVDNQNDTRSYISVSRFEVGGGMGTQKYKVVIVFSDPSLVEKVAKGAWHYNVGAEASAGDKSAEGNSDTAEKGYQAFRIMDSGALASVSVRVAQAKPYL